MRRLPSCNPEPGHFGPTDASKGKLRDLPQSAGQSRGGVHHLPHLSRVVPSYGDSIGRRSCLLEANPARQAKSATLAFYHGLEAMVGHAVP
jgi:hypothetical protein